MPGSAALGTGRNNQSMYGYLGQVRGPDVHHLAPLAQYLKSGAYAMVGGAPLMGFSAVTFQKENGGKTLF